MCNPNFCVCLIGRNSLLSFVLYSVDGEGGLLILKNDDVDVILYRDYLLHFQEDLGPYLIRRDVQLPHESFVLCFPSTCLYLYTLIF